MSTQPDYAFPGDENLDQQPERAPFIIEHSGITTSQSISKLIEALAKAQLNFKPVKKQTENEAYRRGSRVSKYADLNAVVEATRDALAHEGLVVTQWPSIDLAAKHTTLITLLAHSSGEWMRGSITLPSVSRDNFTAQTCGSSITYARRYAWSAIVGVAPEDDDDGNAASGVGSAEAAQAVGKKKVAELQDKLQQSVDSLFFVWYDSSQMAEIKGAPELLKKYEKLLKPFVQTVNGKRLIIANADQLEGLKYEFEKDEVPFHPLKSM
jgi:ERF superfamily